MQAADKLAHGLSLHNKGMLEAAGAAYEEILRADPGNHQALYLLGVVATQSGNPARAVELISEAIRISANDAGFYFNRAVALQQLGRVDAALADYEAATAIRPAFPEALSNRCVALLKLGRIDAALASAESAISRRPDFAEAHFNRGVVLAAQERWLAALDAYARALELKPGYAEAHFNRGNALKAVGRWEEAAEAYRRAIAGKPGYGAAYSNLALVHEELGQWDLALHHHEAASSYAETAIGHVHRANVLVKMKRLNDAISGYERAIAIDAKFAPARVGRAGAIAKSGRSNDALAAYTDAIEKNEGYAPAYYNRANLLVDLDRVDEAIADYERTIERDPEHGGAHYSMALLLLRRGDYEQGWIEHEWRWKNASGPYFRFRREFNCPEWSGKEALAGRSVLLHGEQGLGDSIQFCRYAALLAGLGATVHLEVPAAIAPLLRSADGVSVCIAAGEPLPPVDFHCPLMSLPLAFGTLPGNIPSHVPYLQAEPEKVKAWQERLGDRTRARVGIVWSGGFRPDQPESWAANERRNIPLAKLSPLRNPAIEFYSLQKGAPAESEYATLRTSGWEGPDLVDLTAAISDFSDTAALIENLDLVISVDTSTAHVAGALGKPVWIMNRYDTCWRWFEGRTDSPWYPTARLYRQERRGAWDGVVRRLAEDLAQLAGG